MSETAMLVLIGGRSAVPAIAGILQFIDEVDSIKFLLCNGEKYLEFQKNIESVIQQEKHEFCCNYETDVLSVDPNKFDEVYLAVHKLCQDVKDLKYINLTSVPQTMAISVYVYVQEKYATNALIFSVNTDQSQIIPLVFQRQPISFNKQITVEKYITLCGLKIFKKKEISEANIEKAAKYIVENIELSSKVLSVFRQKFGDQAGSVPKGININEKDFRNLDISSVELIDFFVQLENFDILNRLEISNSNIKFRIETKENYSFLTGDWLEVFVYSSAKKCEFDSVEMGVALSSYKGEIDVFCLKNTNAMICECKTGKISSQHLDDLSSKAVKLGGNYCVKLYITSESEVGEDFINSAKNNRVLVVSAKDFKNLNEILMKEMQLPTYSRS